MDASGVSFEAGLLEVMQGMNFRHEEMLDNVTMCPTAFASKSLSSVEKQYSDIKWKPLGILHGLIWFTTIFLPRKYM